MFSCDPLGKKLTESSPRLLTSIRHKPWPRRGTEVAEGTTSIRSAHLWLSRVIDTLTSCISKVALHVFILQHVNTSNLSDRRCCRSKGSLLWFGMHKWYTA